MSKEFQKLDRLKVESLDDILGIPFKVLDDGFIRIIDYTGSDESIVQAARVSYGKGTKKVSEDRGLIRYLIRNRHTSPFEMCEIKLHVRVPMDIWRQWIRHRTANVNEYSTRYSIAIDSSHNTAPTEWRKQASNNRQGSEGFVDDKLGLELTEQESQLNERYKAVYKQRVEAGIAREQARKDLPLSTYTEAYWKIDLHNLLHFLSLRMDSNAQLEIREYANIIGRDIVSLWCPIVWEAFEDYRLNPLFLSDSEQKIITAINCGKQIQAIDAAKEKGWLKQGKKGLLRNRERVEFEEKAERLGIKLPWLD